MAEFVPTLIHSIPVLDCRIMKNLRLSHSGSQTSSLAKISLIHIDWCDLPPTFLQC